VNDNSPSHQESAPGRFSPRKSASRHGRNLVGLAQWRVKNPSAVERPRSVRDGFDQVLLESQPVDANVLRPYLYAVYFGTDGA
jgi:hypothetical protein